MRVPVEATPSVPKRVIAWQDGGDPRPCLNHKTIERRLGEGLWTGIRARIGWEATSCFATKVASISFNLDLAPNVLAA